MSTTTYTSPTSVQSVSNTDNTLTIAPTAGAVVASTNLTVANTWTALQTFNAGLKMGGQLTVTTDTAYDLGTASLRFRSFYASTQYRIYAGVGDANPTSSLESKVLKLGAGGATQMTESLGYNAHLTGNNTGLLFQTLSANSGTNFGVAPLGTSTASAFFLFRLSDTQTNYETVQFGTDFAGVVGYSMAVVQGGTGSYRPFLIWNGGSEALRITTAPLLQISTSLAYNITSVSASTTLAAGTHQVVLDSASGAANTITLPAANAQKGLHIVVIKTDSSANAVTVAAAGTDTIEGAASVSLATQYKKAHLVSDGTSKWYDLGAGLV